MNVPSPSVLFITEEPVFPPSSGSAVECANMIELLRRTGARITLLSFDSSGSAWSEERKAESLRHVDEFIVIPAKFAASLRYLHLVLLFPWNLLFPNLLARTPAWNAWLNILHGRARKALAGRRFSLGFINKITALELVGQETIDACCDATAIDIQDLHSRHYAAVYAACAALPFGRLLKGSSRGPKIKMKLLSYTRKFELRFLEREVETLGKIDRIVAWSGDEAAYLQRRLGADRVYGGHYPIALPELSTVRSPAYDFGYIGSRALLNLEGLLFFIKSVWPLIKQKKPAATLFIAGGVGADFRMAFPEIPLDGITICPSVPDLADLYDNVRVVVVPLLRGSGVSVKTIEAMSYGCAIVSTSAGVRGLGLTEGNCLVGDSAEDFAKLCLALADDEMLRARLSKTARMTVENLHALGKQSVVIDALLRGSPG